MSRITKFLKQTCLLERFITENGKPKLNEFGEFQYGEPIEDSSDDDSLFMDDELPEGEE